MMNACAWVTHCLGNSDVEKALVLGKSLRRVLTGKSLVTIVQPDISREESTKLEAIFDLVVPLHGWKSNCLKELITKDLHQKDGFALSFAVTSLDLFEKCIFLSPGTLVLKNCDELFEDPRRLDGGNVKQVGKELEVGVGTPLYFIPSHDAFNELEEGLQEVSGDQVATDAKFLAWIGSNKSVDFVITLNGPYFSSVALGEMQPLRDGNSLVIVNLKSLPNNLEELGKLDLELEKFGLLEKHIYSYWLELSENPQQKSSLKLTTGSNKDKEPIAIVGMSCRLPASNNINEFWKLLIEGGDGICNPPEDRFPKEQFPNCTQAGFLTVPVDEFDAKFFGISPKEVMYVDPQIRLLHEVVWEGLEDAGINPIKLKGTPAGVFLGSYQNEYVTILQNTEDAEVFRTWMGNAISAGAARISHLLGLTGPSVGTNPACSASLAALHMAVQGLRQGECNMAITCAVNLILLPFSHDAPGMGAITSSDGHCKTFDASADGFGRAEGCTVLILKRQSEAMRDGDRILGLIRGTAIAQEGLSKSIGTPTAQCEATAMQGALRNGNVDPAEISYIESHGTGTVVGDTTEIHAISKVYGNVHREHPLVIGSVKTNVGHTESCSGITGIIKVLLSMKNEIIPRHINFKQLNPYINLESIPAQLPLKPVSWPIVPGKPRMAGVNSFGFTGMDGHAIVQAPDGLNSNSHQRTVLPGFERPVHIMKITAKTEEALLELLDKYKLSLETEHAKFSDIAYTSNVGRTSFPYRAALIAGYNAAARDLLESGKIIKTGSGVALDNNIENICFLFTGQGSQYHGMAKQLYSTSPIFHSNFDYCDNFLQTNYDISLKDVFFGEEESKDAHKTLYSQTGIFVIEYCLLELWKSWGIKPDIVLGHSLGEFCAAVAAGILDLDDALTLVAERSRLIESLHPGKMLVVKLDKSETETQIDKFQKENHSLSDICLDIAAVNTPEQTVVAGDSEVILEFKEFLGTNGGIKCSVLQSTHAFHSRHMDPMLEQYRSVAEKIISNCTNNCCIFISGMLGKIMDGSKVDADYWVRHTRERVNFLQASKVAYDELGCRVFMEIGPHPVLLTMTIMNNNCDAKTSLLLPSLRRNEPDWETILTSLAKLFVHGKFDVDWDGFDQYYERSKVGHLLPSYPFKRSKFWPKILNNRKIDIHPLLGSAIPNPTHSKLFQCEVNLDKLEYLKDHKIEDMIIFPGAGYMEMLLKAGHAAMEEATPTANLPQRSISISNFKIKAPLGLQEGKAVSCQTVVQHDKVTQGLDGFPAEMYHQLIQGDSSSWIQHASATFDIDAQSPEENILQLNSDQKQNLGKISGIKSTEQEDFAKDLYENLKQLGYNFQNS